jgi:hypothetical protein
MSIIINLVGTIKDSAGQPLSGKLTVTLSAPLVDLSTTPDSIFLEVPKTFTITNGAINISIPSTDVEGISTNFHFYQTEQRENYFFRSGEAYFGPTHLHTDAAYYTGAIHSVDSVVLDRVLTDTDVSLQQFDAIVPTKSQVEFSELVPTGISRDRLPSGARQIAELLVSDARLLQSLVEGVFNYKGAYSATTYYAKGNWVTQDGGSWLSTYPNAHVGHTPAINSTYWIPLATRGANGTGTAGNNTTYDSNTWANQTDAPSRGAIRDIIEQLARSNNVVSPNNAIFSSPPQVPTPTQNNHAASKEFVENLVTSVQSSLNVNYFFVRSCRFLYDFSVNGGIAGTTINLTPVGGSIPKNAVIIGGFVDVITAVASGSSPTLSIGINTNNDLRAAATATTFTANSKLALIPVGATTAVKTTATSPQVKIVLSGAAPTNNLTAGKFYVVLLFVVCE